MTDAAEIGPVEYLIVAFPGNKFRGEIAPALADLVEAGTIRIIDIAFVGKDEDGEVAAFELSDLDPDVREGARESRCDVGRTVQRGGPDGRWRGAGPRTPRPRCSSGRTSGRSRWRLRSGMPGASSTTTTASRTRSSWRRASGPRRTRDNEGGLKMPLVRRGPGLIRGAARVGVAAGVAGRVRHHQDEKWAGQQDQAAPEQQAPQAPPASAAGEADYTAELEKLAKLRDEGVISRRRLRGEEEAAARHLGARQRATR